MFDGAIQFAQKTSEDEKKVDYFETASDFFILAKTYEKVFAKILVAPFYFSTKLVHNVLNLHTLS